MLSEVILIFACFIISTYLVVDSDPQVFLFYDGGLSRITLMVVRMILGLYFQRLSHSFENAAGSATLPGNMKIFYLIQTLLLDLKYTLLGMLNGELAFFKSDRLLNHGI